MAVQVQEGDGHKHSPVMHRMDGGRDTFHRSTPPPPFNAVIHMQESTHKVPKPASHAVLRRMQLTLHATRPTPHGASRLVQAVSA